jgi:hypothetical protein
MTVVELVTLTISVMSGLVALIGVAYQVSDYRRRWGRRLHAEVPSTVHPVLVRGTQTPVPPPAPAWDVPQVPVGRYPAAVPYVGPGGSEAPQVSPRRESAPVAVRRAQLLLIALTGMTFVFAVIAISSIVVDLLVDPYYDGSTARGAIIRVVIIAGVIAVALTILSRSIGRRRRWAQVFAIGSLLVLGSFCGLVGILNDPHGPSDQSAIETWISWIEGLFSIAFSGVSFFAAGTLLTPAANAYYASNDAP